MINKCHNKSWIGGILIAALFTGLGPAMLWGQADEDNSDAMLKNEEEAASKASALPSLETLMNAKLEALKAKQAEQENLLAQAEIALEKAKQQENSVFDSQAYLSLSIINTAPPAEYKLESTDIYIDNRRHRVSRGGPRNQGLPRNKEQIFFSPIEPGCHELIVHAKYVRLKNDLISRFQGVKRIEMIKKVQPFIATAGYRIDMQIEGFEAQNSLVKVFRGPDVRFNKTVRPNFLPGAPLVSMDAVLKQGQVKIDFIDEDQSSHRLLNKSVSIDGLPILTAQTHDHQQESNIVFQAPLAEGKHQLSVKLLLAEKKRIGGGPDYNFKLSFDREFLVASGQTTIINLVGFPEGGFRSNPRDSRYARVTSQIISEPHPEFFPAESCKELAKSKTEPVVEPLAEPAQEPAAPAAEPAAPVSEPAVPLAPATELKPEENKAEEKKPEENKQEEKKPEENKQEEKKPEDKPAISPAATGE